MSLERFTIPVVPIKRVELGSADLWVIDCPYCHHEHRHGAAVGHRVSHCQGEDSDPGYVIERWADDEEPFTYALEEAEDVA